MGAFPTHSAIGAFEVVGKVVVGFVVVLVLVVVVVVMVVVVFCELVVFEPHWTNISRSQKLPTALNNFPKGHASID